jgi:hypothetical protein
LQAAAEGTSPVDDFLERLRQFVVGGSHGEGLDPRISGDAPGFVRDTVLPLFSPETQGARITGVPGAHTGLVRDQVFGKANPLLNSVFINPDTSVEEQEKTVPHELFHVEDFRNRLPPAIQNQFAEMAELNRSRAGKSKLQAFLGAIVGNQKAELNPGELPAYAFEDALDIIRRNPDDVGEVLRFADQDTPGTALAYNHIQRQLANR